jgi:methyltransferase
MEGSVMFEIFLAVVIIQRIGELVIAKRNERWMKEQGGVEYGKPQYVFIVAVHALFFVSFGLEVLRQKKEISPYWTILFFLFLLTQIGRVWALLSLGKYWNTKIIVVPNATLINKGPYKFLKHPNYLIVTIEFFIIPLLYQAYGTLIAFSLLNALILMVRIPAEERALCEHTEYKEVFQNKNKFLPLPFMKKM